MSDTGAFMILHVHGNRGKFVPDFQQCFAKFVRDHVLLKNLEFDLILRHGLANLNATSGVCDNLRPHHLIEFFGGKIPDDVVVLVQDSVYYPDRWIDCGNKEELPV